MPWHIERKKKNGEVKFCVIKTMTDEELKCYDNEKDARDYQKALYANEKKK